MTESQVFAHSLRQWMDTFTHLSMVGWSRYVRASGFSMPQFFILMQVHRKGPCGVSDLGGHMDISPAAASQLVDKLVQSGLLARAEDPQDRRAKLVTLTDKGRALIEQGIAERYRWVEGVAANLNESQRARVAEALELLTQAVAPEPEDPR